MRARLFALPAAAGLALIAVPALPALAADGPAPYCVPDSCVVVYDSPAATASFVVPAGVTVLAVGVAGAAGGDGVGVDTHGGAGGLLEALVPVTPGETLSVLTGARGTAGATTGGSGGGGSFVFRGADALVAAGGGGGGGLGTGGAGGSGGPLRKAALGGANAASAELGGGGGRSDAGGTAPAGPLVGADGSGPATGPSTPGSGGAATATVPSGGGGSGWYGGASGSCAVAAPAAAETDCGGGGGGSSFIADDVTISNVGNRQGDGIVVISYTALTSTTTLTAVPSTIATLSESTLTATVTGTAPAAAAAAAVATKMGTSAAQAAAAATATPTGTVTFFSDTTSLLTVPVDATGIAHAVFTAGSTPGPRTITAQYNGDVNFLQSTSAPAIITVTGTAPTTPQGGGPVLADTGTEHVAGMLVTSAALLLGGAGVLVAGRRRVTPRHRAAG